MDEKRQIEINNAYSKISIQYKELFINELSNKPLDKKLYDLFFEKVVNTGNVLEIGCGPGEISNYLWMKGLNITGIDYSIEMIRVAQSYNKDIKFEVGDVFNLKYKSDSIAGIVAPYLIVNFTIQDVEKACNEMYRILKPKGRLLLTFHIGNDENKIYEDFFESNNSLTFSFFKVETIKNVIIKVGFKFEEVVIKEPYEGEITKRAFVYVIK